MTDNKTRGSMNALEQRIFGLLHIMRGVAMLFVGTRAPNWVLRYAKTKARAR